MSILAQIAETKAIEVAAAKKAQPLGSLQFPSQPRRDFIGALWTASGPAVIAEIKKASPSQGIIRADFDPARIAEDYAQHGARCLSVLTDKAWFQGDPVFLEIAKRHCDLPILRKDFIIDPYQIAQSLAWDADCILLIVAMLDDQQLLDYCQQAQALGLAVLVESHTEAELDRALRLPTTLIGINNRSLHDFKVDLQTTIRLRQQVPADRLIICESGIHSPADVQLMQSHGIHCFLIGESLMRQPHPGLALADLIQAKLT